MKRLIPLMLFAAAGTAQPLLAQNTFNPLTLLAPAQGSPWSGGYGNISSPFGLGALNPLNPINSINPLSPWNSYGGLSNPVLSLGALGAINALTPNMLPSSNSYAGNPFAGNPFGGNPYSRSQPSQFFGAPAFTPSMPSYPNMPFAVQQPQSSVPGGYFPMQQQQMYPYMPYGAQQQYQAQQPSLGSFFGMQAQPVPQPQASFPNFFNAQQPVQQQQSFPNFFNAPQPVQQQPSLPNFFGMTQSPPQAAVQQKQPSAQPVSPFMLFQLPQAPQGISPAAQPPAPAPDAAKAVTPAAQPANALPFFFFTPQTSPAAPVSTPLPASAPAIETKPDNAAPLPPLDPAAFMQMYMAPAK